MLGNEQARCEGLLRLFTFCLETNSQDTGGGGNFNTFTTNTRTSHTLAPQVFADYTKPLTLRPRDHMKSSKSNHIYTRTCPVSEPRTWCKSSCYSDHYQRAKLTCVKRRLSSTQASTNSSAAGHNIKLALHKYGASDAVRTARPCWQTYRSRGEDVDEYRHPQRKAGFKYQESGSLVVEKRCAYYSTSRR